ALQRLKRGIRPRSHPISPPAFRNDGAWGRSFAARLNGEPIVRPRPRGLLMAHYRIGGEVVRIQREPTARSGNGLRPRSGIAANLRSASTTARLGKAAAPDSLRGIKRAPGMPPSGHREPRRPTSVTGSIDG